MSLWPKNISNISWTMSRNAVPTSEGDSFVFEGY